ncbi:hypothetical protein AVEN_206670-1 [Araneus ventricosus]|uniref:Uncharacterized protein n=1 Tax=Araneus ventricosus TaxID=182803 RepID=A0A4Y2MTM4_ARAVE|nr:hypothetical protein AVEN_206670-1 [Araneus ventricosus]
MNCYVFPSREDIFPREGSRTFFPQTTSQTHLVVCKRTFAKVTSASEGPPRHRGINNCQGTHMVSYQEISGVLSSYTCIALVVMKPRNLPTVGIDHYGDKTFSRWSHGSPVIQWKEREAELHPLW